MGETTNPSSETYTGTQFTVDLSQVELTDEECNAFQNQITKLAVECVQKASGTTARKPKEPFVRIIFVKAVPNPIF